VGVDVARPLELAELGVVAGRPRTETHGGIMVVVPAGDGGEGGLRLGAFALKGVGVVVRRGDGEPETAPGGAIGAGVELVHPADVDPRTLEAGIAGAGLTGDVVPGAIDGAAAIGPGHGDARKGLGGDAAAGVVVIGVIIGRGAIDDLGQRLVRLHR